MKTQLIEYPDLNITLTISESSARVGLYRTLLSDDAIREESLKATLEEGPLGTQEISDRILHTVLYPAMIASVVEQTGFDHWPLTFQEFSEIPEGLEVLWETATFNLNPHWRPSDINIQEAEKKVTGSTSTSSAMSTGTKRRKKISQVT